jgi:hypothetical protein
MRRLWREEPALLPDGSLVTTGMKPAERWSSAEPRGASLREEAADPPPSGWLKCLP